MNGDEEDGYDKELGTGPGHVRLGIDFGSDSKTVQVLVGPDGKVIASRTLPACAKCDAGDVPVVRYEGGPVCHYWGGNHIWAPCERSWKS